MSMATPTHRRRRSLFATILATMLATGLVPGAAAQSGDVAEVPVEGFAFPPETVVDVGTAVVWQNLDPAPHTVTASDGSFDSGVIDAGGTFEFVFAQPGVVAYSCLIHPSMTGTITVRAAGDASVSPAPGLEPPTTDPALFPASATTVLQRVDVYDTDPLGIGGRALTLLAPDGWLVEGGPVWRHQYANLATFEGRIASPDLYRAVEFFPLFPQVWQEGGIPFFPEGSIYLGNEVRPPIRDAAAFLEALILPAYRAAFEPRIIGREALPDVAQAFRAASLPGSEVIAERVLTEHVVEGERMLEEFTVVLTFTPNPGLPGAVQWMPQQLFSLRAPADEFDAVRPGLQAIASSPVVDPTWGSWYEYVLGLSIQNGLDAIRAAGAASRIISQTNAEITDDLMRGYEQRQAVNDRIHEAWARTIREVDLYDDPWSDDLVELPIGYSYTYAGDNGAVVLTNDPAFDPIRAFPEVTWESMEVAEQ